MSRGIYILLILIVVALTLTGIFSVISSEAPRTHFHVGITSWIEGDYDNAIEGFRDTLAQRGFIEGKNLALSIEFAEGEISRQRRIIKRFLKKETDLIYVISAPSAQAAKEMTSKVPVVFTLVNYPLQEKLIASLEDSRNNLVGVLSYVEPEKQLVAFERFVPFIEGIAFVHRKDEPDSTFQLEDFRKTLDVWGIGLIDIAAADAADITAQLHRNKGKFNAVYLACDTLISGGGDTAAIEFSEANGIPNFACGLDATLNGALVGNVVNYYNLGAMAGEKAALILKGASPRWIASELPRESFIVVNKEAAEKFGLDVP